MTEVKAIYFQLLKLFVNLRKVEQNITSCARGQRLTKFKLVQTKQSEIDIARFSLYNSYATRRICLELKSILYKKLGP